MKREQLTPPKAGDGGGQKQRCVLLVGCGPNERQDLFRGEHLDVAAPGDRTPLDFGDRIDPQTPDLPGALEDAVEDDERESRRRARLRT
jgi:hypothetical protein